MKNKAYTTSTTIVAILSILLLTLVCCCMLGFAFFGLRTDQQNGSVDQATWVVAILFSCCGLCLPTLPLAIWGISYFFGRKTESEVEQNLAAIQAPDKQ